MTPHHVTPHHVTPHHTTAATAHLDKHSVNADNLTPDNLATADTYLMTETILNEAMQYHNITMAQASGGGSTGTPIGSSSACVGTSRSGQAVPCSRRGSVKSQRANASTSRAQSPNRCSTKVSREEAIDEERKEEIIREWHLLARVLDRILFCIVFLTMLCCALFILLSPWYAGKRKIGF